MVGSSYAQIDQVLKLLLIPPAVYVLFLYDESGVYAKAMHERLVDAQGRFGIDETDADTMSVKP